MFLLFAFSTCQEPSNPFPELSTDSSLLMAGPRVRREAAVMGGLVAGLAVAALLRLTQKAGRVELSQLFPESASDASDDEDPDCPGEYGLRDAILVVGDDEPVTDLPRAEPEHPGEWGSDDIEEIEADADDG
jgi:hypothetical protein